MIRGLEVRIMGTRREQWAERVERWRRSGLTAKRFAASIGVSPGSLTHWAWRLGREARTRSPLPALIEVVPRGACDNRFELALSDGRRLHIPASFEAAALERLLAVLEAGR